MPAINIPSVVATYDPKLGKSRSWKTQHKYMEELCLSLMPELYLTPEQAQANHLLRQRLHEICMDEVEKLEGGNSKHTTLLKYIGGHADGTAIRSSGLDFFLTVTNSASDDVAVDLRMPQLVQKALLQRGFGAKLVSKSPHPVLRICTEPSEGLLRGLCADAGIESNRPRSSGLKARKTSTIPKEGVGLQCKIHFAFAIALDRAALVKSYCLQDPRIGPMIMVIKHWARVRGLNDPAAGTLDSFALTLMVLYFTLYVIEPPIIKPLQEPPRELLPWTMTAFSHKPCWKGHPVTGWKWTSSTPCASKNYVSAGALVRDFFFYFGWEGKKCPTECFNYKSSLICIRPESVESKFTKDWLSAQKKFVKIYNHDWVRVKVLQYNHLAIQDPWDYDLNLANKVKLAAFNLIRNEFKRAVRIQTHIGMIKDTFQDIFEAKKDTTPKCDMVMTKNSGRSSMPKSLEPTGGVLQTKEQERGSEKKTSAQAGKPQANGHDMA